MKGIQMKYKKQEQLAKLQEHLKDYDHIIVEYSGSGDDGQIWGSGLYKEDGTKVPNVDIPLIEWTKPVSKFIGGGKWVKELETKMMSPLDVVEDICDTALCDLASGWQDDEGGYGEFIFDIKKQNIEWIHNEAFKSYKTTTTNINLMTDIEEVSHTESQGE
jgi:hypothetical protein